MILLCLQESVGVGKPGSTDTTLQNKKGSPSFEGPKKESPRRRVSPRSKKSSV